MADDFGAENLEDGEQWLPPDFFSIEEVQISNKKSTPSNYCPSSTPSSCMEILQHSSSSTYLQRRRPNGGLYKPLTTLQVESSMRAALYQGFRGVAMSPRGGTGVFLPPVDENQKLRQRGKGRIRTTKKRTVGVGMPSNQNNRKG